MDKRLSISLQGGRKVSGVLRGFDIFLNLVVDDAVEESGPNVTAPPTKNPLGQIVCDVRIWFAVTHVNFISRSFEETASHLWRLWNDDDCGVNIWSSPRRVAGCHTLSQKSQLDLMHSACN